MTVNIDLNKTADILKKHESNSFNGAFKHVSYSEKLDKSIDELFQTDPRKVIKWGWELWDRKLGGIYGGKIYTIGGDSGMGKSTFINQLTHQLSMQGVQVTKYALEDRMQDIGKEDLFTYSNRIRFSKGMQLWHFPDFMNNEYTHESGKYYNSQNILIVQKAKELLEKDNGNITELEKNKMVTIDDMILLMEEEVKKGTKVFIIDHLHYFKRNDKERTDLEIENTMHDLNEIARKYNVAIFLVAHYRKLNSSDPNNDSFKDASAIKQVSNIIIHITREGDDGLTKFTFGKIRGKIKLKRLTGNYDIGTDSYTGFFEDND